MSLILIIHVTYDVSNINMLRMKWISYVREQWKNFKTMLTTHYIYGEVIRSRLSGNIILCVR